MHIRSGFIDDKNSSSGQRIPIQQVVGPNIPNDAVSLINQLLIFNPHKRLKAEEALEHEYVARFHDSEQEVIMQSYVIIPLNDDIRLSVDEYRNKLYELMAAYHHRSYVKAVSVKPKLRMPEVYSKVSKSTEKYIKSHINLKTRSYVSQSEPKMSNQKTHWLHTANIKSDSKVVQQNFSSQSRNRESTIKTNGDCRTQMKSNTEVPKRKLLLNKPVSVCMPFNSYNKNHGIITQSALMELRAAGLR